MTTIMVPWRVKRKIGRIRRENGCKIIANNLKKADWSWGCAATVDYEGRTIWSVDAHRDDGQRFVVLADEKLTAFEELESAIHAASC